MNDDKVLPLVKSSYDFEAEKEGPTFRITSVDEAQDVIQQNIRTKQSQDYLALETKRLEKTRLALLELENRMSRATSRQLSSIIEQSERLRAEEAAILSRIKENNCSITVDGSDDASLSLFENLKRPKISENTLKTSTDYLPLFSSEDECGDDSVECGADLEAIEEGISDSVPDLEEEAGFDNENLEYDDSMTEAYKNRLLTQSWITCEARVSGEDLKSLWTLKVADQQKILHFDQILSVTPTSIPGIPVPSYIWERLFLYQRRGLEWLLGLWVKSRHVSNDNAKENFGYGGILADEMGLGKTVQIIALLASLHCAQRLRKKVLIICPATVMQQWRRELHTWWPCLRVLILSSHSKSKKDSGNSKNWSTELQSHAHVILSTYGQLMTLRGARILLGSSFSICVLDEGHLIRNVNTGISKRVRQIKAPLRLILSGTPMQNNLTELWSLVDFCVPSGLLGPLALFKAELADPIAAGGWLNATSLQIATSRQCAAVLRDLVRPVMLRRTLNDVKDEMLENNELGFRNARKYAIPKKSEQVVYCQPSNFQRLLHEKLMQSEEMNQVIEGRRNILWGIDQMTKLCNHPWLVNAVGIDNDFDERKFTDWVDLSGKLSVTRRFLREWMAGDHWVLLFCQTRQMLNFLEKMLQEEHIKYLRMDGTIGTSERSNLIDKFNKSRCPENSTKIDSSIARVMLLTTKVGGIGINLTAADRVIIYEPDWNPATDHQARSRAHRLGQVRPVQIYRLLTAGSIEERVFERQVYKIWLGGRILLKGGLLGRNENYEDGGSSSSRKIASLHDLFSFDGFESDAKPLDDANDHTEAISDKLSNTDISASDRNIFSDLLKVAHVPEEVEADKVDVLKKNGSSLSSVLIMKDAQRLAQNALHVLKASQKATFDAPWTKKSAQSTSSTISGNDILQAIYARQALRKNDSTFADSKVLDLTQKHAAMLDRLLSIFTSSTGSCKEENIEKNVITKYFSTQHLIDCMESFLADEIDRTVFRLMLRTIAAQVKRGSQIYWSLKHQILDSINN